MKLFYHPMSHHCRRVTALAHHINMPLELQLMDVAAGAGNSPDYLKMNPNGAVPTLQDGDFNLGESNAIMQYLAEKKGDTVVWPMETKARAQVSSWMHWNNAHFNPVCSTYIWENLFKKMMNVGAPDSEALKEADEEFEQYGSVLNQQLSGRKFILGETVTLADFSIASSLSKYEAAAMPVSKFENIKAWYARMAQLDAWKRSEPKMN